MAFDQSPITAVVARPDARELLVSWTSTAAAGTVYQVYLNNVLTWHGTTTFAHLPMPSGRNTAISVGTVGSSEAETDFSADLPALTQPSKLLSWEGGTFLGSDISGFRIYGSASAGGAVDYTKILSTIPAYPAGVKTDGYGLGGYGHGGYGRSASVYSWRTPTLGNGTWTFAVVAYDKAGNQLASPTTVAFTIAAAPRPPAVNSANQRLTFSYDATSHVATLNWLASPN